MKTGEGVWGSFSAVHTEAVTSVECYTPVYGVRIAVLQLSRSNNETFLSQYLHIVLCAVNVMVKIVQQLAISRARIPAKRTSIALCIRSVSRSCLL